MGRSRSGGMGQSRPSRSRSRLGLSYSKMSIVFPVIFLIVQVLVPDCEGASASSRSPSSSSSHHSSKEWEESSAPTSTSRTTHLTTTSPSPSHHTTGRSTGGRDSKKHKSYMVEADELTMGPAYEQSVNPFLFHLEQGWRLKPVRHRYLKKKLFMQHQQHLQQQHHQNQNQHQLQGGNKQILPSVPDELPMDPSRPHFVDSNEATDNGADENRAFGDEEKDLRDLLSVLFSPDY